MKFHVEIAGQTRLVEILANGGILVDGQQRGFDIRKVGPGSYHILINGHSFRVQALYQEEEVQTIRVNGELVKASVQHPHQVLSERLRSNATSTNQNFQIKAPMAGQVISIAVSEGQEVPADSDIVVLEAMKMENVLKNQEVGTVTKVHVTPGQAVEKNEVLVSFGRKS